MALIGIALPCPLETLNIASMARNYSRDTRESRSLLSMLVDYPIQYRIAIVEPGLLISHHQHSSEPSSLHDVRNRFDRNMGTAISSCFHEDAATNAKFIDARYSNSNSTSESNLFKFRRSSQYTDIDQAKQKLGDANSSMSTVAEVVDTKNLEIIFDTMESEERCMHAAVGADGNQRSGSFNEWIF